MTQHATFNSISHFNSLNNSQDTAISVGWTERPSHQDIKYLNSQKSHLTRFFLVFLYLSNLNLISPMEKCTNKGKTNILYYVLYCKKGDLFIFLTKKNIEQKYICHKNLGYMGKLLIVWKCAYSAILKFLWQISSCKIGVKMDKKLPFFGLGTLKYYCCLHVNVNLDIIIYNLYFGVRW